MKGASMLSQIKSATLIGTEAVDVTVEVTSQKGLPREHIVGLPGPVIKESKNRIQSAIKHNGFYYPMKTYTINLAPAEIPKEGPFLDLPIAVALLDTIGDINADHDAYYVGELSLSGDLKPIRGILSICQHVSKSSKKRLYLPYENANLAQLFEDIDIVPIQNLRELTDIFKGKKNETPM